MHACAGTGGWVNQKKQTIQPSKQKQLLAKFNVEVLL